MPNYRRALVPGASWFFTVNLLQRRNNRKRTPNSPCVIQAGTH